MRKSQQRELERLERALMEEEDTDLSCVDWHRYDGTACGEVGNDFGGG